jgi:hypothetical protein
LNEELPDWLQPLAAAAAQVRAEDMSRFLPPDDGSGRASAVLIAFCEGPAVLLSDRPGRCGRGRRRRS